MRTWAGAPGVPLASSDVGLRPIKFLAETRKSYELLFDSPVTVVDVLAPMPSLNTDQVPPVVSWYSIT